MKNVTTASIAIESKAAILPFRVEKPPVETVVKA